MKRQSAQLDDILGTPALFPPAILYLRSRGGYRDVCRLKGLVPPFANWHGTLDGGPTKTAVPLKGVREFQLVRYRPEPGFLIRIGLNTLIRPQDPQGSTSNACKHSLIRRFRA